MNVEDIKKSIEAITSKIEKEFAALHKRIDILDVKIDPALEAVKKSKLTPVWVALLAVLCFAAGIWVGGLF